MKRSSKRPVWEPGPKRKKRFDFLKGVETSPKWPDEARPIVVLYGICFVLIARKRHRGGLTKLAYCIILSSCPLNLSAGAGHFSEGAR